MAAIFEVYSKVHDKTEKLIWILSPIQTLKKNEYDRFKRKVGKAGGYYSRFASGFIFNYDPSNLDWVQKVLSDVKESTTLIELNKLDLPTLDQNGKKPRKNIIIAEIKAGRMEYAPYREWNSLAESDDFLTVTNADFKPAQENKQLIQQLEKAIGQQHFTESVHIEHDDKLGYFISFKNWYIRYKTDKFESKSEKQTETDEQILKAVKVAYAERNADIDDLEDEMIESPGTIDILKAVAEINRVIVERYPSYFIFSNGQLDKTQYVRDAASRVYKSASERFLTGLESRAKDLFAGKRSELSTKDKIPGGLGQGRPDTDFDPEALAKGTAVETEHTSDLKIAKEIVKDHLTEDSEYYDKLEIMEKVNLEEMDILKKFKQSPNDPEADKKEAFNQILKDAGWVFNQHSNHYNFKLKTGFLSTYYWNGNYHLGGNIRYVTHMGKNSVGLNIDYKTMQELFDHTNKLIKKEGIPDVEQPIEVPKYTIEENSSLEELQKIKKPWEMTRNEYSEIDRDEFLLSKITNEKPALDLDNLTAQSVRSFFIKENLIQGNAVVVNVKFKGSTFANVFVKRYFGKGINSKKTFISVDGGVYLKVLVGGDTAGVYEKHISFDESNPVATINEKDIHLKLFGGEHLHLIEEAISNGLHIPTNVLIDYPHLIIRNPVELPSVPSYTIEDQFGRVVSGTEKNDAEAIVQVLKAQVTNSDVINAVYDVLRKANKAEGKPFSVDEHPEISEKLLSEIEKQDDYFANRVKEVRAKHLFFPIILEQAYGNYRGTFAYIQKPNKNTVLQIRKKDWGDAEGIRPNVILYDSSLVDENYNILDTRFEKYDQNYGENWMTRDTDEKHLYRGMSGEEFNDAIKNGYFKSDANMNFSRQEETTSFAQNSQQAFSYAFGFAAWHDMATFDSPRYVIKVRREGIDYQINEVKEADVISNVPISNLVTVWEIRLTETQYGDVELVTRKGMIEEGSRSMAFSRAIVREWSAQEVEGIISEPIKLLVKPVSIDMLRDPRTKAILEDLGDKTDPANWIERFHAKPENYKPDTYYHVESGIGYAGVGNGLYVGRDKQALVNFYDIEGEGKKVIEYTGSPKWLDLTDYDELRKFEAEYGTMTNSDIVLDVVLSMGYDGIKYYDPQATGEEYVLFNTAIVSEVAEQPTGTQGDPQGKEWWEMTKAEFTEAVYNGIVNFQTLGGNRINSKRLVDSYHATTDPQNKAIAKKNLDDAIDTEYTASVVMAMAEGKPVPLNVREENKNVFINPEDAIGNYVVKPQPWEKTKYDILKEAELIHYSSGNYVIMNLIPQHDYTGKEKKEIIQIKLNGFYPELEKKYGFDPYKGIEFKHNTAFERWKTENYQNLFNDMVEAKTKEHLTVIEHALSTGKFIPPEVLDDYPELQPIKPISNMDAENKIRQLAKKVYTLDTPAEYINPLHISPAVKMFFITLKKSIVSPATWSIYGAGFVPFNAQKIIEFFNRANIEAFQDNEIVWAKTDRIQYVNGVFLSIVTGQYKSDAHQFKQGTLISLENVIYFRAKDLVDSGKITQERAQEIITEVRNSIQPELPSIAEQLKQPENKTDMVDNKSGTPTMKKILLGREIQISMPNGEKRKGQFVIAELDEIQASHDEVNFHSNPLYPTNESGYNINDRNYKDDPSAQKQVMDTAKNLEPERVITTSRTPSGTPIVTKEGFVVSGNQRTMGLKLAATEYPENYVDYINYLGEEAESFGFTNTVGIALRLHDRIGLPGSTYTDPLTVKFDHPVLVRIDYDIPALTTQELAKYNKDTKKSERPIDKAIKLSNILRDNPNCAEIIAETTGEFETFSDFYANLAAQKRLSQTLVSCNLLTDQEMPAFFSGTTFTETGKEFIENMLAALILDRDTLMATEQPGVKSFRQKIITSLPVLMHNASLPEGSLKEYINQAVRLQQSIKGSGSEFNDFIRQYNIFDVKYDRKALYLNRLLDAGKLKFKSAIEGYNEAIMKNQGAMLFGDNMTPDQIFDFWIVKAVDNTEARLIESSKIVEGSVSESEIELVKIPEIPKTFLREQDGVKIYLVDGEVVRKDHIQYVAGGHGYVYDWIPKDEVWIDENQKNKPEDMEATIRHELYEIGLMKKGMDYDNAHEEANKIEIEYRRLLEPNIDITKPVKLRNPEVGEADTIFRIANYNDEMKRAYIEPLNSTLNFPGQELVSIFDLVNVEYTKPVARPTPKLVRNDIQQLSDILVTIMPEYDQYEGTEEIGITNKETGEQLTVFNFSGRTFSVYNESEHNIGTVEDYNYSTIPELAEKIKEIIKKYWKEPESDIYYTNAPEAFDGFGTKTIGTTEYQTNNGKPIRKISITPKNYEWQSQRNSSGMYITLSETDFAEWVENGNLEKKVKEVEKPIETIAEPDWLKKEVDGDTVYYSVETKHDVYSGTIEKTYSGGGWSVVIFDDYPKDEGGIWFEENFNSKQVAQKYAIEKLTELRDKEFSEMKPDQIATKGKEPWEMTQKEYVDVKSKQLFDSAHGINSKGKPIVNQSLVSRSESKDFKQVLKVNHSDKIKQALSENKPVPQEVLAEYSDLRKTTEPTGVITAKYPHPILKQVEAVYLQAIDKFDRNRVVEEMAYELAGDGNSTKRQEILSAIRGEKVPVSKSGMNEVMKEFKKWIDLYYTRDGKPIEAEKSTEPEVRKPAEKPADINVGDVLIDQYGEWKITKLHPDGYFEIRGDSGEKVLFFDELRFYKKKEMPVQEPENKVDIQREKIRSGITNPEEQIIIDKVSWEDNELNIWHDGDTKLTILREGEVGVYSNWIITDKFKTPPYYDNAKWGRASKQNIKTEIIRLLNTREITDIILPSAIFNAFWLYYRSPIAEVEPEKQPESLFKAGDGVQVIEKESPVLAGTYGIFIRDMNAKMAQIETGSGQDGRKYHPYIDKHNLRKIDEGVMKIEGVGQSYRYNPQTTKTIEPIAPISKPKESFIIQMLPFVIKFLGEEYEVERNYNKIEITYVPDDDYLAFIEQYAGKDIEVRFEDQHGTNGYDEIIAKYFWDDINQIPTPNELAKEISDAIKDTLAIKITMKMKPKVTKEITDPTEIEATFHLKELDQKVKEFEEKPDTMKETTLYYKMETRSLDEYLVFLKKLKDYIKSGKVFSAGIGVEYLILTGDYDKDAAMHPSISITDFDDIISNSTDIQNYNKLSSKPHPEKLWKGEWVTINERIKHLESVLSDDDEEIKEPETKPVIESISLDFASYENPYLLNRAIEKLLDSKPDDNSYSFEEKAFLSGYTGYGGLDKFAAKYHEKLEDGTFDEFYTPDEIVQQMWGLAYRYGFTDDQDVLETSAGIGAFLKYAPSHAENVTAIEINPYSGRILKIIYKKANVLIQKFERIFIKDNSSVKGISKKFQIPPTFGLVIGNPPYGKWGGYEKGMGEKSYTKASNIVEYFITRGLDMLQSDGLLIYIEGAETITGGKTFMQSQLTACKKLIAGKADLVKAYGLPNGVFDRTDVLSEIIVFRKK